MQTTRGGQGPKGVMEDESHGGGCGAWHIFEEHELTPLNDMHYLKQCYLNYRNTPKNDYYILKILFFYFKIPI